MADIRVTCVDCGAELKISEFADPEQVKCSECGGRVEIPEVVIRRSEHHQKKGKKAEAEESPLVAMYKNHTAVTAAYKVSEKVKKRRAKDNKIWVWSPNKATLLVIFILGTGILSALRFLPFFADEDLEIYKRFGVIALAVGWLLVVVDAFADNVMHGLLCIFVPFYFIYYLFSQCDSFLLRVGVGILLIPFGVDTLLVWWKGVAGVLSWMGAEHLNESF